MAQNNLFTFKKINCQTSIIILVIAFFSGTSCFNAGRRLVTGA